MVGVAWATMHRGSTCQNTLIIIFQCNVLLWHSVKQSGAVDQHRSYKYGKYPNNIVIIGLHSIRLHCKTDARESSLFPLADEAKGE